MSGLHARTGLSTAQYALALAKVRAFLTREDRISNRKLREITGLNYDRASKFFNIAIADGTLIRRGHASGIHYVLPQETPK